MKTLTIILMATLLIGCTQVEYWNETEYVKYNSWLQEKEFSQLNFRDLSVDKLASETSKTKAKVNVPVGGVSIVDVEVEVGE